MPAGDIFGIPTTVLSKLSLIEIDAVLEETHTFENLVTEHPVEDGSPRTDNIVNLPLKLEMTGRITDTPSSLIASLASGAAGLLGSQLGIAPEAVSGASSLISTQIPGRSKSIYQELVALYQTRSVFDVLTGLHEYKNMTFSKLEFPRQAADGRSIRFRAQLQELIVVGSDVESNADRVAEEVANSALSPDNLGQQPLSEILDI